MKIATAVIKRFQELEILNKPNDNSKPTTKSLLSGVIETLLHAYTVLTQNKGIIWSEKINLVKILYGI